MVCVTRLGRIECKVNDKITDKKERGVRGRLSDADYAIPEDRWVYIANVDVIDVMRSVLRDLSAMYSTHMETPGQGTLFASGRKGPAVPHQSDGRSL